MGHLKTPKKKLTKIASGKGQQWDQPRDTDSSPHPTPAKKNILKKVKVILTVLLNHILVHKNCNKGLFFSLTCMVQIASVP